MSLQQGQHRFKGDNSALGRNPFGWSEFDGLPRPVRDAINYALSDLGSRRARMNLLAGKSVEEVCAIERAVGRACARRDYLAAYGPDHPFVSKARVA